MNVNLQDQLGNAGRNILRADGIGNVDFGVIKNVQMTEDVRCLASRRVLQRDEYQEFRYTGVAYKFREFS